MTGKYTSGKKFFLPYVENKIDRYEKEEKNMATLFRYMFSDADNPMAETSDGYKIKVVTYGECKDEILRIIPALSKLLSSVKQDSIVGLYMENSLAWIQTFWAILALGYKPLLLNLRTSKNVIDGIISQYDVGAVISDGKDFDVLTVKFNEVLANATNEKTEFEDLQFANEVIFMSSGTTDNVKLCSYRAKNFFYQIKDSVNIIKQCPKIYEDYEGQIKHLALLPFYHVFGFIAMYLWFGFFARTFVFLKDMRPKTILNTVRKHKVTHIFAVPLVWDNIYKEVLRNVKAKGEKTEKRFEKGMKIASTDFGKKLVRSAFEEIRSSLFGESVKFMISGGSHVRGEVIKFFNAIGYHLCNGYGMTEIGITSVELSDKINILSSETVGKPFLSIEYKINENGELCVRGKSMARKINVGGVETVNDYDAWFNTKDLAKEENGRYYILGRRDDVIVCENGENLNPAIIENAVRPQGVDGVCLVSGKDGKPTLIVSCPKCYSKQRADEVRAQTQALISKNNLDGEISRIEITTDPLMEATDFKVSRKKIAEKYTSNKLNLITSDKCFDEAKSGMEAQVCKHFATVLKTDEQVSPTADFFTDLGGTSLDYFELTDIIKTEYGVDLPVMNGVSLTTARQVCEFLLENL